MLIFVVIFFVLVGINSVLSPVTIAKEKKRWAPTMYRGKFSPSRPILLAGGLLTEMDTEQGGWWLEFTKGPPG